MKSRTKESFEPYLLDKPIRLKKILELARIKDRNFVDVIFTCLGLIAGHFDIKIVLLAMEVISTVHILNSISNAMDILNI